MIRATTRAKVWLSKQKLFSGLPPFCIISSENLKLGREYKVSDWVFRVCRCSCAGLHLTEVKLGSCFITRSSLPLLMTDTSCGSGFEPPDSCFHKDYKRDDDGKKEDIVGTWRRPKILMCHVCKIKCIKLIIFWGFLVNHHGSSGSIRSGGGCANPWCIWQAVICQRCSSGDNWQAWSDSILTAFFLPPNWKMSAQGSRSERRLMKSGDSKRLIN